MNNMDNKKEVVLDEEKDNSPYQSTKKFKGYLILDWNTGTMRIVKTKPAKYRLKPHTIIIDLDIDVNVPKMKHVEIKGSFDIPAVVVKEAMLNDI